MMIVGAFLTFNKSLGETYRFAVNTGSLLMFIIVNQHDYVAFTQIWSRKQTVGVIACAPK